jgi:hypothetical protein
MFFAAIERLLNLRGEPCLLQGYDVTEVHLGGDTLTGAQYDSENCTRRREKRAANLSASMQTLPCSKPVIVGDGSLFPVCVGR